MTNPSTPVKLLHIDSSILGEHSVSRTLSADITRAVQQQHPESAVTYRDLAQHPLAHLSGAHLSASSGNIPDDAAFKADIETGAAVLEEFLAADIIILGAPMYNFTIPTQLKAWVDRICVAGKTFRYTANGAEGLAGGKKIFIAISRGGFYGKDTPLIDFEHQESYLRILFNFLGITDLTFIRAEGLSTGEEARNAALTHAKLEIETLILP
tara:strand:+ start:1426 stop:2058 length:633 start_codon:yes stop_codon:yes gene_type:complete